MDRTFYSQVLLEHDAHPHHKHSIPEADFERHGVNPACGDDVSLYIKMRDGVIQDGSFTGDGCVISQASTDFMFDLVMLKTKEEVLLLIDIFRRMITGEITEEEKQKLLDARALECVRHMPSRKKCALLGWETLEAILSDI